MKIAVVGSREFKDKGLIFEILRECYQENLVDKNSGQESNFFISGGARGVDSISEGFINDWNERMIGSPYKPIVKKIFLPDWDKYGKRAGYRRNDLIIQGADRIIAFWDGESKGTKHSIDLAIKAGKPIDIYVRK